MSSEEVAELFGFCLDWVRLKARKGEIPALKDGRKWIFCKKELLEFKQASILNKTKEILNQHTNTRDVNEQTSEGATETSDIFC